MIHRPRNLTSPGQNACEAGMRDRIRWFDREGQLIALDGLFQMTQGCERTARIVLRVRIAWI